MRLIWFKRHRKLDRQLAEARERAADAAGELAVSEARATTIRETVVRPLWQRAEDNQFAELLRRSLQIGYRNGESRQ